MMIPGCIDTTPHPWGYLCSVFGAKGGKPCDSGRNATDENVQRCNASDESTQRSNATDDTAQMFTASDDTKGLTLQRTPKV